MKSRIFDVTAYGAVGDGVTDNTAAFSRCVREIVDARGGQMFLPAGVYCGRIVIPPVAKPWVHIEIVGEVAPWMIFGTIGECLLNEDGVVIKCLDTEGPAVIVAERCPEGYSGFSAVSVTLRNLDIRTYDNPKIDAVDFSHACQCKLENVFINTGIYNVLSSEPTHGTYGLKTPKCDNGAYTVLRNVTVTGYHTGILAEEHTDGDNINLASNVHGVVFVGGSHASHFARLCAQRNTHIITVKGWHAFSIEQLNTERPGPGQWTDRTAWQCAVADVNDPDNFGIGDINYWVVIGNVGAQDVFTVKGGKGIKIRRIGDSGKNIERN